jgi:hypothetical protein
MDRVAQYGRPLIVDSSGGDMPVRLLTRVPVGGAKPGTYSEGWLQRLIHRHPNLLPIDQIEPALIPLIPSASSCRRLPDTWTICS